MPITIQLPNIDENPILLAETRPNKISEFIKNLPYGDPLTAAHDLIDELQIINSQRVAFANRLNALELYRPAAMHISQSLLPRFNNASLPISKNDYAYVEVSERLWEEIALGYKSALVDLQNKILNLNSAKSTAQIVQRAIHALKEIALVYHLSYRSPPPKLWSELHQLYYCAIQQAAERLSVDDPLAGDNTSTVSLIYKQVLLMALADPQHLVNTDILKAERYLAHLAQYAELRPLGFVETPTGIFLLELNSNKPPTPFVKKIDVPDDATDLLLNTISVARQIHQHLKSLQEGILPKDQAVPSDAIETHFGDLLSHFIQHFGKSPKRVFSRMKKSEGFELGVGIKAAYHLLNEGSRNLQNTPQSTENIKASRWQVLNVSAGGFALRKFNSSPAAVYVGDLVAMKNTSTKEWEIAILRWANINELKQLDIGLQLISPSATPLQLKIDKNGTEIQAIGLPPVSALKHPASILVARGVLTTGENVTSISDKHASKMLITRLIERSADFERYEFSLI